MLYEFKLLTNKKNELIDITSKIQKMVTDSQVYEGICQIFIPHTTAAVTINENADPSVKKDIILGLNKISPHLNAFTHLEGNSDAHIKSSLVGTSEQIIINNGKLILGTWQGIYFCEFDGPRTRKVVVFIKS